MMEIELERYQNKFNHPMVHNEATVNEDANDYKGSVADLIYLEQKSEEAPITDNPDREETRINKVYGARAAYIANTLLTDTEYTNVIFLWAVAFAGIILGLNKLVRSGTSLKVDFRKSACEAEGEETGVKQRLEAAFSMGDTDELEKYAEMPAPVSNSDL